jgi:hypothetical protein
MSTSKELLTPKVLANAFGVKEPTLWTQGRNPGLELESVIGVASYTQSQFGTVMSFVFTSCDFVDHFLLRKPE